MASCRPRPRPRPLPLFPRPLTAYRPTRAEDAERDVDRHPHDHSRDAEETIQGGGEKADEDCSDRREHGDHATLPDVVEGKTAVPPERTAVLPSTTSGNVA